MDTKAQLQKLIEQIKTKQFRDGEAQGLTKSVGGEITKQLKPAFEALGKDLTSNISSAIKELKINVPEGKQAQVNVNVPDVIVPDIKVPEPKVTVNIPPFPRIPDFPKIEMPETMNVLGQVEIAGNDYDNPLKVQLVDLKNRPYESVSGASGNIPRYKADTDNRQVNRPIQVRGMVATAYVEKTSGSTFGSETTLLASGSGTALDLIYVMGTNNSDIAIYCDIRASTGGSVVTRLQIPATGTVGFTLPTPYPAPFTDHTWTVDFPDVTGTTCSVSALFSREI